MSDRIAARHFRAAGFEHEHTWSGFSGHKQRLILAVALYLAEAQQPIDFCGGEFGKQPCIARIDRRHGDLTSSLGTLPGSLVETRSTISGGNRKLIDGHQWARHR